MTEARDAAERRRALDPEQSFIVQAPAGSGKTGLLAQRFLALLARVDAPEEVLALTFTRKAAGEMRNRIVAALESAAREAPPADAHQRLTWELARAALTADAARGWNLRLNPARLRVQTLDALCGALVRQMPVLSAFGAPPGAVEDAGELYREAARRTIAQVESGARWSPAIAHLLGHLDNHLGVAEGLIAAMLARRDQWLRHALSADRPGLEAALRHAVAEGLEAARAAVPARHAAALAELMRYAADNVLHAGGGSPIRACHGLSALPGVAPEDLPAWHGIAALLLTGKGDWRVQVRADQGFPPASSVTGREAKARCQAMKDRMGELLAGLAAEEELLQRLQALRELPPLRYEDDQWATVAALIELLPVAAAMLDMVFRERGEVDFTRVAQAALQALGEPERPTDLALALDYRMRHILVDEFQDTSFGQYALLERLTEGWEPGDGRTLFLVGDPMQSIYRFREAEVGLFLRARAQGIGRVRLQPLQLQVNFRSQRGIVDWVNSAFARILPEAEDPARGAVRFTPSVAQRPGAAGAAVCVHPLLGAGNESEAEAAAVLRLVQDARARAPDGTIAILVRSRTHLENIVARLKAAGVRFRAVEIERLGHRPAVQDLLALTLALAHPADRIAWLALLRAPWCGLTLHDLHALAGRERVRAVWDLMADPAAEERLSADGYSRLQRVRAVLERSLAARGRRPLRRWIEDTWIALGGPACVEEATDLEDAALLLGLLEEFDEGGELADRTGLMEAVARLYALPDVQADAGLQVMTVHKAKGLEFDTVILPGLGRTPPRPEPRLLMWLERPRGHGPADLLLAPIRAAGAEHDAIYRYIAALDREKERLEDGRLLYVAATRARERLHLLGCVRYRPEDEEPVKRPPADALLAHLWPVVEPEFAAAGRRPRAAGERIDPAAERPGAEAAAGCLRRLIAGWRLPPAPAPAQRPPASATGRDEARAQVYQSVEFAWASETARHVGTVVHRLLQQCARDAGLSAALSGQAGASAQRERLAQAAGAALESLGVPPEALAGAAGRVVEAVMRTLADPRGRWILDPGQREARCEYAVSGLLGDALVTVTVDRTFVDAEGTRWIIDYKTGTHEGGGREEFLDREQQRYRAQLERYAALLGARDPRPIRLGLYFPLLQGWREWAPAGCAGPLSAPGTGAYP